MSYTNYLFSKHPTTIGCCVFVLMLCFVLLIAGSAGVIRQNDAVRVLQGQLQVQQDLKAAFQTTSDETSRVLALAQANQANGNAAQAYTNADLTHQKTITEQQTRDVNKVGWVGVFAGEHAGDIFGYSACVWILGIFTALVVLWNLRPHKTVN